MTDTPFVGLGHSPDPDVPDMPTGLGMHIMQDPKAMAFYGALSAGEKSKIIQYVQKAENGEDAKNRIAQAVSKLSAQDNGFTAL